MPRDPEPVVSMELSVGSATSHFVAPCPHCGKPLKITGEHPPAKVQVYKVESKAE